MRHESMHTPDPSFPPADENAWAYWRARHMVRALRGWYLHLIVYVVVITWLWFRFVYFAAPSWSRHDMSSWPWPLSTALGWGLGFAIHGALVWMRLARWGRDWEACKIKEFMDRQ